MRVAEDVPAVTLLALERVEWPEGQQHPTPPAGEVILLVPQKQVQQLLAFGIAEATLNYHLATGMTRTGGAMMVRVDSTVYELLQLKSFGAVNQAAKVTKLLSLPLVTKALHTLGLLTPGLRGFLAITSTAGLARAVPQHQLQLQQWQQEQQQAGAQLMECTRPFTYTGVCSAFESACLYVHLQPHPPNQPHTQPTFPPHSNQPLQEHSLAGCPHMG